MHYVTYQRFSKWVDTFHITCKTFDVCLAEMKNLFLIIFIWLESQVFQKYVLFNFCTQQHVAKATYLLSLGKLKGELNL